MAGGFAEALAEAKADTAKYIETLKEKSDHRPSKTGKKGAGRGAKKTQALKTRRRKK